MVDSNNLPIWEDFYQFKKFSLYEKLFTRFRVAGKQHPVCFVDYSKTVPHPKRSLIYKDIEQFWANPQTSNKTFAETLDTIVLGVIDNVEKSNKKLAVWYSGGTDSLAILSSVIKNSSYKFKKEKLVVRLTKHSIEEYPWFFENYIQDKLHYEYSSLIDYFKNEFVNIDGVFGDTVFGEHYIPELIEAGYLSPDVDWIAEPVSRFEEVLNSVIKDTEKSEWLYNTMVPMFKKFDAQTVFDAFWLQGAAMNLNQLHWMPFMLDYRLSSIDKSVIQTSFEDHYNARMFSNLEMFKYAFTHRKSADSNIHRARISSNLYSLDFSGDRDYFDNKKKVSSQIKMYSPTPYSRLLSDFTIEANIIYRI